MVRKICYKNVTYKNSNHVLWNFHHFRLKCFCLDTNRKFGKEKIFKKYQLKFIRTLMKSQKIPVIQFNQAPLLSTCTLVTNTGSYLNIPTKKKLRLRQSKQLPNIFKRCMQNPVKHLSCSLSVKKMNIFRKCSFLHVWKSSEYTSAYKRSHIAKQTCKQTFLYEGNTGI